MSLFDLVQRVDMYAYTRYTDTCDTHVDIIEYGERIPWLRLGMASVRVNTNSTGRSELQAYLNKRAADCEHDSGHALLLPLIGLHLKQVMYQMSVFTGWIGATEQDCEKFHVPTKSYDPFAGSELCTECETAHPIVKNYTPPIDMATFKLLRGHEVEIRIGPKFKENE